ncbi:phosphatases II [Marasmius fiardii PR-910]|nr:phosphatases II [Marasmius fiardii PR-910]
MSSPYHSLSIHTMPHHSHAQSHRHNPRSSTSDSSSADSSSNSSSYKPPSLRTAGPSPLSAPLSLASSMSGGGGAGSSSSRLYLPPSRAAVLQSHSPHVQPSVANEIIPRLFISDLAFAENPNLLAAYRITHVLSILPERISVPPSHSRGEKTRMQVCVEDFPFAELAAHLPATTKFIRDGLRSFGGEGRVLVHCAEGISRSVSVVAAFLMAQYGWTPVEAVACVKEKRRIANPNFGFVKQLYEYGRESLGMRGLVDGM